MSFLITAMQLKAKMSNLCEYVINIISYVCTENECRQFSPLEWGICPTLLFGFGNATFYAESSVCIILLYVIIITIIIAEL